MISVWTRLSQLDSDSTSQSSVALSVRALDVFISAVLSNRHGNYVVVECEVVAKQSASSTHAGNKH